MSICGGAARRGETGPGAAPFIGGEARLGEGVGGGRGDHGERRRRLGLGESCSGTREGDGGVVGPAGLRPSRSEEKFFLNMFFSRQRKINKTK